MAEYTFEDTIPVAPLKIAALESCRELAEKVNEHIITFRRHDAEALKKKQKSIEFRGYDADTYLMNLKCSRF